MSICSCPPVMGVTDVVYRLLATDELTLAEVQFELNGIPYTLRASGIMDEDISGVYTDGGDTAFAGHLQDGETIVMTDTCKLARWLNISGQYVLIVEDNGVYDEETFAGIVDEMMDITNPYQPADIREGVYFDRVSERASLTVTALEDNLYEIEIHWADSAFEDNVWTMTAAVTEDGLLTYHDCVMKHVVTAEDGTVDEKEANLNPDGYFELVDGHLLWTGAAEESCRECDFELYAE